MFFYILVRMVYYGPTYPDSILFFNPSAQQGTPEGDRILSDPGNALEPLAQDKREASSRGENDDAWSTQRRRGSGRCKVIHPIHSPTCKV